MYYNPDKYTRMGVGEKITPDCFVSLQQPDESWTEPMPVANNYVGVLVHETDEEQGQAFFRINNGSDIQYDVTTIAHTLGLKTEIGLRALRIALENIKVLDSKQCDYGSGNISAFGEYGVLVRVTDKHARLKNLLTNGGEPKNESVMDTWLDIGNYAIIAMLCRRGEWR